MATSTKTRTDNRDPQFSFRMAEADVARIRKAAKREGLTISDLMRDAIEQRIGVPMSATKRGNRKAS